MTAADPNSILDSVKKVLGFDPDDTSFDLDVILFINATMGKLRQLGIGSDTGFVITSRSVLWSQYITNLAILSMVKQYIFMSVRLAFDPPATSFGIESFQKTADELGWRILSAVEEFTPPSDPNGDDPGIAEAGVMKTFFAPKVVQLTYAATVTPDASEGNVFYLDLTADATINPPVNGADGQHITLELISNGFIVTWGSGWNFGTSGVPVLSGAGKSDIISAVYKGSATEWRAGYTPGF